MHVERGVLLPVQRHRGRRAVQRDLDLAVRDVLGPQRHGAGLVVVEIHDHPVDTGLSRLHHPLPARRRVTGLEDLRPIGSKDPHRDPTTPVVRDVVVTTEAVQPHPHPLPTGSSHIERGVLLPVQRHRGRRAVQRDLDLAVRDVLGPQRHGAGLVVVGIHDHPVDTGLSRLHHPLPARRRVTGLEDLRPIGSKDPHRDPTTPVVRDVIVTTEAVQPHPHPLPTGSSHTERGVLLGT